MKKKRNRERLDWSRSIEEHPHQETAAEEMASLIHPRIRYRLYAAASVLGLVANDINAEEGYVQRCPKCRHRSLRKVRTEDKESYANWRCFECGNDTDEFGNKL
jgi:DNA-directed RNA polymerase subunit RPC12/RpoP